MINYVCTKCKMRLDVIVNGCNGDFSCKCLNCNGKLKREVPYENPYSLLKQEIGANAYADIPIQVQ